VPRYTENFYVLKSDTSIKHGLYKRLGYNNEIILQGNYKNGKQDSLWLEYLRFTTIVISKGYYFEGKKSGVWEYYNSNGTIACKHDYNMGSQLFSRKEKLGHINETFVKQNDTNLVRVRLQREAFFNGTQEQFWNFITQNTKFPGVDNDCKKNKCTVFISFMIDANGSTNNFKIIKGINQKFNDEALRVAQLIPNDWIPALYDGKPIASQYELPIRFVSSTK
jgi:hypothetical protein